MFRKMIILICFCAMLTSAKLPENNKVKIDGSVTVTIWPRYSRVKTGGWARMECRVEPKDAYIMTWWKFDNDTFKPIGKSFELQLWNISKKNEGWYACTVSQITTLGMSGAYLEVIE